MTRGHRLAEALVEAADTLVGDFGVINPSRLIRRKDPSTAGEVHTFC
jgi:hypothetical protein